MPFKISFLVETEEDAKAFVIGARATGSVCWVDVGGNKIERSAADIVYEEV
jgi:hypothetical protein